MANKLGIDERVWAEHEAATFYAAPDMLQGERDQRTNVLYESCRLDGKWIVSIADAELVTVDAAFNAMIGARYGEVEQFADKFFSHPDAAKADSNKCATLLSLLGPALLMTGEIERGLEAFENIIKCDVRKSTQRLLIRSSFVWVLEELGKATELDPRLRDFAVWFLKEKKSTRAKAKVAAKANTCRALIRLLTYSS